MSKLWGIRGRDRRACGCGWIRRGRLQTLGSFWRYRNPGIGGDRLGSGFVWLGFGSRKGERRWGHFGIGGLGLRLWLVGG